LRKSTAGEGPDDVNKKALRYDRKRLFYFIYFYFIILLFSIIIHEVSHGYTAEILGDDTARVMGRLTLNPIVHLDPIGSVIFAFVFDFNVGYYQWSTNIVWLGKTSSL